MHQLLMCVCASQHGQSEYNQSQTMANRSADKKPIGMDVGATFKILLLMGRQPRKLRAHKASGPGSKASHNTTCAICSRRISLEDLTTEAHECTRFAICLSSVMLVSLFVLYTHVDITTMQASMHKVDV